MSNIIPFPSQYLKIADRMIEAEEINKAADRATFTDIPALAKQVRKLNQINRGTK